MDGEVWPGRITYLCGQIIFSQLVWGYKCPICWGNLIMDYSAVEFLWGVEIPMAHSIVWAEKNHMVTNLLNIYVFFGTGLIQIYPHLFRKPLGILCQHNFPIWIIVLVANYKKTKRSYYVNIWNRIYLFNNYKIFWQTNVYFYFFYLWGTIINKNRV